MIQISKEYVHGWEAATRGLRNPFNSWAKSDSSLNDEGVSLGENDLTLMKRLSSAGTDHSKFLRMITVTMDINAPLYWWKEFDTYKVGTVANSTSTMHKIHEKEFEMSDFSHEHLIDEAVWALYDITFVLNRYRDKYIETGEKDMWWQMIQLLPSSYNQLRTVQVNYQVLQHIYRSRKNHKLDEWKEFCDWCLTLPYFKEICAEVG